MKILYFYPENPLLPSQGNNARAFALLQYFKDRKINVDFVGIGEDSFTNSDIDALKERGLISNGYLLHRRKKKSNQLSYFFNFSLPRKVSGEVRVFDRRGFGQQESFNEILKNNTYDFIIVSYVVWAPLVRNNPLTKDARLVIDTHDFLTSQFQTYRKFSLGKYFEAEIDLLKVFEKVLVISNEEKYLFSQFLKNEVSVVTHALPNAFYKAANEKKHDLIYVASDNEHNIKSIKWFFDSVYPMLANDLKICIVGRINNHFGDYPNVEKITFVEDLDAVYATSKIAICPMLSGTGLKIKVVEALSFGLPVVCNEKGVDGMSNKSNNGCLVTDDAAGFAAYISKLLTDTSFYEQTQMDAKRYFTANYDIKSVYAKIDKVFEL
jgi:glycosyltransferase involved in cell wall biosynthesis